MIKEKYEKAVEYVKRENRWMKLAIASQSLGIALFILALFINMVGGTSSFGLCMTMVVFSLLCLIPGIWSLWHIHRQKQIREGKIAPKAKANDNTAVYNTDGYDPNKILSPSGYGNFVNYNEEQTPQQPVQQQATQPQAPQPLPKESQPLPRPE